MGTGGAFFELCQNGAALEGFTLNESVLLRGNWIDGRVGWGEDTAFGTRVLTRWSTQQVQVRVAMRDAELFSLSMGCTQRPHYTQCAKGRRTALRRGAPITPPCRAHPTPIAAASGPAGATRRLA